jgi:hypothetical protein
MALALVLASCGTSPTASTYEEGALEPKGELGESTQECPVPQAKNRILVDASHDGGVWWFPQEGPFDPAWYHQGSALAGHFRQRGYTVQELGRGEEITGPLLAGYGIVVRVGKSGSYKVSELEAYEDYVGCDATLLLLGEFMGDGARDPLAERLGLVFTGSISGTVTEFEPHAITTGVTDLPFIAGSFLSQHDPSTVQVLGRLNGHPVMGIRSGYAAKVFFLGDSNGIQLVPQPLVDNLLAWGF